MSGLSDLKTPGPTVIALTAPFWRAAAQGRLQIQRCADCGEAVFYPRAICPHCWSARLEWEEASGRGRLKSFTIVHKPGHPGWLPAAPYIVGLVELDEGPTMTSFILADGEPTVGDRLELQATDVGGRILPAFRVTTIEEHLT